MNVTWVTSVRHSSRNYSGTVLRVPGHYILSLYEKNYTIKVFEKLSVSRKQGYMYMSTRKFHSLKMDLIKEYQHPKPFPTDMFLSLPNGSPDQAYVILGQKGTGKTFQSSLVITDRYMVILQV